MNVAELQKAKPNTRIDFTAKCVATSRETKETTKGPKYGLKFEDSTGEIWVSVINPLSTNFADYKDKIITVRSKPDGIGVSVSKWNDNQQITVWDAKECLIFEDGVSNSNPARASIGKPNSGSGDSPFAPIPTEASLFAFQYRAVGHISAIIDRFGSQSQQPLSAESRAAAFQGLLSTLTIAASNGKLFLEPDPVTTTVYRHLSKSLGV